LNLSLLNLSDGCEQFDQVIIACRPGQLRVVRGYCSSKGMTK
jgi:hypothetical protein